MCSTSALEVDTECSFFLFQEAKLPPSDQQLLDVLSVNLTTCMIQIYIANHVSTSISRVPILRFDEPLR